MTMTRHRALWDILLAFAPLLVLGLVANRIGLQTLASGVVINVGYILSILVATRILTGHGRSWRDTGLARPKAWWRTAVLGLATMVAAVIVIFVVTVVIVNLPGLPIAEPDVTRFNPLAGNLLLFLGYLALAWTVIAFGEEMLFRAFLTDRLAAVFHGVRRQWTWVALGGSLAFGLAHYGEGLSGIVSNGTFGLLFVIVYLRTGRNLWVTIIAHGLLNTLRFAAVYAGLA